MRPVRFDPVDGKHGWFTAVFPTGARVQVQQTGERNYSGLDEETWEPIYRMATRYIHPARVIDFGSGSGYGSDILTDHGFSVIGVEKDQNARRFAEQRAPRAWFLDEYPVTSSADAVVAIESIEHVEQSVVFQSIQCWLRRGGVLFLSTPDRKVLGDQAGKNPFHVHEYTYDELHDVLVRYEFENIERLETPGPEFANSMIIKATRH